MEEKRSFSGKIREELSLQVPAAAHCRIAEVAAILSMCGGVSVSPEDRFCLRVQTENFFIAKKYFTLLKRTFNIEIELLIRQHRGNRKGRWYLVCVKRHEDAVKVLQAVGMMKKGGTSYMDLEEFTVSDSEVIRRTCCRRAFLRGAFLVSGSVSDPKKDYHLEFACTSAEKATQIREVLRYFRLDARIVRRKKYQVVYLKEGDQIVDALNVMGAHQALMDLENVRILKEMRNSLNRKVNCETANISRTVNASYRQTEDIRYLRDTIGFDELPEELAETAELRLQNPDATLKELGMLLSPQVGKSGVNHRLRKLSELARELRGNKEEKHYDEEND